MNIPKRNIPGFPGTRTNPHSNVSLVHVCISLSLNCDQNVSLLFCLMDHENVPEVWTDAFVFSQERCSWNLEVIISVLQSWEKNCIDSWEKLSVVFREESIPFIFSPSVSSGFWFLSILIGILKRVTCLTPLMGIRKQFIWLCMGAATN